MAESRSCGCFSRAALLRFGAVSFTPLNAASPTCPDAPGCLGSPDWDALYPTLPPNYGEDDVPCPDIEECPPLSEDDASREHSA